MLVADDLAPADTVGLDPATVLALVTERGSPTSHTAILARSLGLPAVVGLPGAAGLADGTVVRVDGAAGTVEVAACDPAAGGRVRRPSCRTTPAPGGRRTGMRCSCCSTSARPPTWRPGRRAAALRDAGSRREGVGLFRTEFLFLDRHDMPAPAEQQAAYEAAFRAAGGRKVVLRTLDAGADKPLPFLGVAAGAEPGPGRTGAAGGAACGRRC